jgi:NADPH:quinone reductase-like Zn-dependent oxidoreductase
MQAIIYTQYGSPDVLRLAEVEKPSPQDDEVLIKVYASSVNAAESHLVRGEPFMIRFMAGGLRQPKNPIPGADVAGRVEAVGKNVTQFRPGDEVFGDLSACGWGAFAEYVCAPESALALKPANTTFEAAAVTPLAAVTALQCLRDTAQIQPGQKVLVIGAGGGVGSYAVQIAKALGAEVTGVCSTRKVELVRSLGADQVIDYTKQDVTQNGQQYDLILDTAAHRSMLDYKQSLRDKGIYALVGGATPQFFQAMLLGPLVSMSGGKKFRAFMAKPNKNDLTVLKGLLETSKVVPVIDKSYPLSGVADALRYLEAGQAQGKVAITMAESPHNGNVK